MEIICLAELCFHSCLKVVFSLFANEMLPHIVGKTLKNYLSTLSTCISITPTSSLWTLKNAMTLAIILELLLSNI
jgi:hypothetical protein